MNPQQMAVAYDDFRLVLDTQLANLHEYNLGRFEEPILVLRSQLQGVIDELTAFR